MPTLCSALQVSPENIPKIVTFGDMSPPAMDFLETLTNQVFLKLLTNPDNMSKLNDITVKEMLVRYHRFLAQIEVTIGLTKGKTLLPIPQVDKVRPTFGLCAVNICDA